MAQPSPIHSWKLIVPGDVSAVKLGASSFMRNMNCPPEGEAWWREWCDRAGLGFVLDGLKGYTASVVEPTAEDHVTPSPYIN
jgi:hypothetical protein